MFQTWRFKLREVEEALRRGHLESASQLIREHALTQYLPGQELAAKVAAKLIERAGQQARNNDFGHSWQDLEFAEGLGGDSDRLLSVRDELICRALDEVENELKQRHPARALEKLSELKRHQAASDRQRKLAEVARRLQTADELARQGKFADADRELASAAAQLPDAQELIHQRNECQRKMSQTRRLIEQLQRALIDADWQRSLELSDELLSLAPDLQTARDARHRALAGLNGREKTPRAAMETEYWSPPQATAESQNHESGAGAETMVRAAPSPRFLLWIDAVGGYFVCLAEHVLIGQAVPDTEADVPIQGDLSRRHAKIRRDGEHYLIEPIGGAVRIGGRSINSSVLLADGDEIELGKVVRLRFRKPHPLSVSARLDFISRHRTQPWADGVLLMGESCVLGPNWHNHVVCRDWRDDVVLFRQGKDLYCRGMQTLEIDGKPCDGRGKLTCNSHITSDDFAITLEEIPMSASA